MKKTITLAVLVSSLLLSGCAGLSESHKAESKALKAYQQSDAKVDRKAIKLGLASAASALALKNVVKSTKELEAAKAERKKTKEALKEKLKLNS